MIADSPKDEADHGHGGPPRGGMGDMGRYPPDLQEEAVKTVLAQAELLCADLSSEIGLY